MSEEEREKDIGDELDEMIGMLDEGETAEPVEEEGELEQAEEVVEEPEQEEDVEEESEPEPEPVEEPAEEPVAEGPASDDELAALREQNEALLKHVESLSSQVIGGAMGIATKPEEQAATPEPEPIPQTPNEVMNYLENTSIDDLLEDPEEFNAVLNQVSQRSTQTAVQSAVQQVLRSVPELVMGYITRHSAMNRMVDDFYRENEDLVNVKQTVAAVANDIHAKNPELGVDEVFKQRAAHTRKLLGLKRQAQTAARRKPAKPAFAKAGGARQKAPAVDPIQREINDLLNGDF